MLVKYILVEYLYALKIIWFITISKLWFSNSKLSVALFASKSKSLLLVCPSSACPYITKFVLLLSFKCAYMLKWPHWFDYEDWGLNILIPLNFVYLHENSDQYIVTKTIKTNQKLKACECLYWKKNNEIEHPRQDVKRQFN